MARADRRLASKRRARPACPYTRDEMLTRPFAIDPDDTTA